MTTLESDQQEDNYTNFNQDLLHPADQEENKEVLHLQLPNLSLATPVATADKEVNSGEESHSTKYPDSKVSSQAQSVSPTMSETMNWYQIICAFKQVHLIVLLGSC